MKMKFLGMVAALALFASCASENAQADPVDVSFTASGSARHWLLDFSVTNHIGDDQRIYFFNVALPSTNLISSPPNWGFAGAGNVGTRYNNPWCVQDCLGDANTQLPLAILPGQTLSGFEALDIALGKPKQLPFLVYSAAPAGGNPVIEGTAFRVHSLDSVGVPAPIVGVGLPGFMLAVGVMGLLGWRRKRRAQAVA